MTKVKELVPETEGKIERALGADIETATLEELQESFDKLKEEIESKTYGVTLPQESIKFLIFEMLPNIEWVGQQAWDIAEMQKAIVDNETPDVENQWAVPSIRATFQFLANNKFTGVDNVKVIQDTLTIFAEVIQNQINRDEQIMRDAGFELQAAEQGILPETHLRAVMQAQSAGGESAE